MDFISGALVGGLLYDIVKYKVTATVENMKIAFKESIIKDLKDEEILLIKEDLEQATDEDKSSKENLEKYFEEKAENTKEIVNKYKAKNIQIGDNNTQINQENRNGDNVEGGKTVNNYFGAEATKEELKKH